MLAILFPGQGSQYTGMGKSLYDNFQIVRETYDEASDSISLDIKKLSFDGPEDLLKLTENTQPAILTHSIAAFRVFKKEFDITKDNLCAAGHSLGEFSALVASGALDFFDAVKLVKLRGEFMQNSCKEGVGTMSAIIGIGSEEVKTLCESVKDIVVPANFNSENQTVISGYVSAVNEVNEKATEMGGRAIPLAVSAPFHSPLMKPAAEELSSVLADTKVSSLNFPYIANVTAEITRELEPEKIKELLVKQLYSPVKWLQTMQTLSSVNVSKTVELGPGKVLSGLMKKFNRKIIIKNIDTTENLKTLGGV